MKLLQHWPVWVSPAIWTVVTVALGWALGHGIGAVLFSRMPTWLPLRQRLLVQSAARLFRRRLPVWTSLVGLWVAAGYWPLNAEGHLLVERLLFVAGAISVTLAAATVASESVVAFGSVLAPALPASSLTRNIAWVLVTGVGVLMILNGLGLSITPLLTALGLGGLAVALALQEPLANFFAGVFLTLSGQLHVGDYVKLDSGQEGYILDFSWRSTRLRMLANNLIVVPNSRLAQAIIVNHHLPSHELAVLVEVGVDYASDLTHVEEVVKEVGREVMTQVSGGVPEFDPFIRYHSFADSSINFTVVLRAKQFVDQYLVKHEFVKRLHARFNREGIVIPFPIRMIAHRDDTRRAGPSERADSVPRRAGAA